MGAFNYRFGFFMATTETTETRLRKITHPGKFGPGNPGIAARSDWSLSGRRPKRRRQAAKSYW
jgi:hypothetical protein